MPATRLRDHLPSTTEPRPVAAVPEPHTPRLDDLMEAERDIVDRLTALDVAIDFEAMAAISNIYRAAAAIRRHMEQHVLASAQL